MIRTSTIVALLALLSASPTVAHQGDHGDYGQHIDDHSVQQATLPSTQPPPLTIVNPNRLTAPPYVIPQQHSPVQKRPARRPQPCARWIDEGCR